MEAPNCYASPQNWGAALGDSREERVARLVRGRVAKDANGQDLPLVRPNVGKTGLDVLGPNGEYVFVGGGAKAKNFSKFVEKLKIGKWAADQQGVRAMYYFDEANTPDNVIRKAEQVLGKDNVFLFSMEDDCDDE
ncbi:hypothetical protein ACFC58_03810 [Kitasatospora purpeofusca]|uniref:hypothetical protein n=1 Tax=Kitasatospora purpeofusca TaxID=67352 RepID=UPI0035DB348F